MIIWYNALNKLYEYGSQEDFHAIKSHFSQPDHIQVLDIVDFASTHTLMKITHELNKCQGHHRHP